MKDLKEMLLFPIVTFLPSSERNFRMAEKTINWKIYQLKSEGVLSHISRGFYSFRKKNQYHPELSSDLKRIYTRVKRELPLVKLSFGTAAGLMNSRFINFSGTL